MGIELHAGNPGKAVEAVSKARELYASCGNVVGQAAAMETIMGLYLEVDMYTEAVKLGKEVCELYRGAGDKQREARALVKLGSIMLDNQDHDKAGKVAEVASGIFAGINDNLGLKDARDLLEAAKSARVAEEISIAINTCSNMMHVPPTLVVDPGLSKRIQESYTTAISA